jgi:hypothetical protein
MPETRRPHPARPCPIEQQPSPYWTRPVRDALGPAEAAQGDRTIHALEQWRAFSRPRVQRRAWRYQADSHVCVAVDKAAHRAHRCECRADHGTEVAILLHSPEAEVNCFTFALRLSLQTRNASGVLVVEAEKQLCDLQDDVWAAEQKLRASPLHFLTILLDRYGCRNEARREYLDARLVELEDKMGVSPFISTTQSSSSYPETCTDSEESIIHELHDNNTRLIWLSGTINFEIKALDFAMSLIESFDKLSKDGSGSPVDLTAPCAVMLEELKSLKSSAELRQFQRHNLQLRAETRTAMVRCPFSLPPRLRFTVN